MKKTIITVLALSLVLSGCLKTSEEKEVKEVKEEVIKIGLSSPMSGEATSYGEAFFGGATLAVKEINDAGGINGKKIELVVEDDECSSKGATVIKKMIDIDKVTAIVGPLCSSAAGPGIPIAQKAGIPTIIVGSAPELTKVGDYIFRDYPSDILQGKFAAEFVNSNLKKKKAAIIYVHDDWGQGLKNVFIDRFEELGGEVVFSDAVLPDSTDIRTLITKAKATNPDMLYFPVRAKTGVIGLKQIKEMNFDVMVVGADGLEAEEVWNVNQANGTLYTFAKVNDLKKFQEKVKKVTGKNSNAFTPYAYDAVKIFAKIIENIGTDRKAIRDELAKLSFTEGISSPIIEFDENGDLKSAEFEVKIIKNGEAVKYNQ